MGIKQCCRDKRKQYLNTKRRRKVSFCLRRYRWFSFALANNTPETSHTRRKSAVFLVFLDWMMNENKGEGCKVLVVTSAWKQ